MRWLLLACAGFVSTAFASESAPITQEPDGWARYRILTQRNIFSKERGRSRHEARTTEAPKEKEPEPPPRPEADIMLLGIVQKDGKPAAFVENRKTGSVQSLRVGDSIARGTVSAITLENLEYTCDGTSITVNIGRTFEGGEPAAAVASTSTKSTASGSSAGASDANAVLERMRKKRQEEMGK